MDKVVERWVTTSKPLESRGLWKRFVQERNQVLPQPKPSKSISDKYQDYLKAESYLEPSSQMFVRDEMSFDEGGLATPKRGLVDEPGSYAGDDDLPTGSAKITKKSHPHYGKWSLRVTEDGQRKTIYVNKKPIKKEKSPPLLKKDVRKIAKEFKVKEKDFDSFKDFKTRVHQKRGEEKRKEKLDTDKKYYKKRIEQGRKYSKEMKADPKRLAQRKATVQAYSDKQREIFNILKTEKTPKGYLWRDLVENGLRYQKGSLNESHIRLKDNRIKRPKSLDDVLNVKLVDINVLDKNGKPVVLTYDNFIQHIDKNQKRYGMSPKDILTEYDKKIFIHNNPEIRDMFNKKMYKTYDPSNLASRRLHSPYHIHHTAGRGKNAFNVQFVEGSSNFKENFARRKFNANWKGAETLTEKKVAVKTYLDEVPEGLEVRLKKVPYGKRPLFKEQMSKFLKGKELSKTMKAYRVQNKQLAQGLNKILDCKLAAGVNCDDPMSYYKSLKEQEKIAATGKGANKLKAVSKVRAAKNLLYGTIGPAALAVEGAIAGPIAGYEFLQGALPSEILNTATYGIAGKDRDEVIQEASSEEIFKPRDFMETGEKLESLYADPITGGYRGKYDRIGAIEDTEKKFRDQYYDSYFAHPKTGDFSESIFNLRLKEQQDEEAKYQKQRNQLKQERADKYTNVSSGLDLPEFAGGGIAGIRRPHAIPPKSGPMPQGGGLSSMFNRVRKW